MGKAVWSGLLLAAALVIAVQAQPLVSVEGRSTARHRSSGSDEFRKFRDQTRSRHFTKESEKDKSQEKRQRIDSLARVMMQLLVSSFPMEAEPEARVFVSGFAQWSLYALWYAAHHDDRVTGPQL